MNLKLLLCALGFHHDLSLSTKSESEETHHCKYCNTFVTIKSNGKKSSSKKE